MKSYCARIGLLIGVYIFQPGEQDALRWLPWRFYLRTGET